MIKDAASAPVTSEEMALVNGFMLGLLAIGLAGIVVPIWSSWQWRGAWRIAAAVPAAMVLVVILLIVVGTALDPTSHNLWPFEVVMFSALSLAIVGVLKVLRKSMGVDVPDP